MDRIVGQEYLHPNQSTDNPHQVVPNAQIRFWIITNKFYIQDFKLGYWILDENGTYQNFNSQTLDIYPVEEFKLFKIEVSVGNEHLEFFKKGNKKSEYLHHDLCYILQDQKGINISEHYKDVFGKNLSFGKLKIWFFIKKNQNDKSSFEKFIPSVLFLLTYSKCSEDDLIEFLKELRSELTFFEKSNNSDVLVKFIEQMKNSSQKDFELYLLALELFDFKNTSLKSLIFKVLKERKDDFMKCLLNFKYLFQSLNEEHLTSFRNMIAFFAIDLKLNNHPNSFLKEIVEKYKSISEDDPQKESLNLLKFYLIPILIENQHKENKKISIDQIKFLINSVPARKEILLNCISDINDLFEILKILDTSTLTDEVNSLLKNHLIRLLEKIKVKTILDEEEIELFRNLDNLNEKTSDIVYQNEQFQNLIFIRINNSFSKNYLFDKLCPFLEKMINKFKRKFIFEIIHIDTTFRLEYRFKKLFKLVFEKNALKEDIKSDLKATNYKYSTLLSECIEEIYTICIENNDSNFMKTIYEIIGITLSSFEDGRLQHFQNSVTSEHIIQDALEYMILNQIQSYNDVDEERKKIIKKIQEFGKSKQRWFLPDKPIFKYIEKKMNNHLQIKDSKILLKLIFENQNQSIIEDWIDFLNPDKSKVSQVDKFKEELIKEFENLSNGNLSVEKFTNFIKEFSPNSKLEKLFGVLNPPFQFQIYSKNLFRKSIETLGKKHAIITEKCGNCIDFEDRKTETDFNCPENRKRSVIDFENYSKSYMKDLDWEILFISVQPIFLNRMNSNINEERERTCEQHLKILFNHLDIVRRKREEIRKNYRNMTLTLLKETLEADEKNISEYIEAYFSGNDSKSICQTVELGENLPLVLNYLNLVEIINIELNFKFTDSQEIKALIETVKSLNEKNSLLIDFENISNFLKENLDQFNSIKELTDKFKFMFDLKEPLLLLETMKDQFDRLKEFVTDFQEFEFSWTDIDNLEIIILFFEQFRLNVRNGKSICKNLKNLENILENLKSDNEIYHKIEEKIRYFKDTYQQYKSFFEMSSNKAESLRQEISLLMAQSTFEIDVSQNSMILNINVDGSRKSETKVSYQTLEEKRNIIIAKTSSNFQSNNRGIKKLSSNTIQNEKKSEFTLFVNFFGTLETLNDIIMRMKEYGYDFSNEKPKFQIIKGGFNQLIGYIQDLNVLDQEFKNKILEFYKNSFLFTFLHKNMLTEFTSALQNTNVSKKQIHLLKSLGLENYENLREYYHKVKKNAGSSTPIDVIYQVLESETGKTSSLIETNDHQSDKKVFNTHFYAVKIPKKENKTYLYKTILGVSIFANQRLPKSHNILFCNPETSIGNLSAFINRIYNCGNNQAFMIVKPELLSLELQESLINLINSFQNKRTKKSYLFFLYFNSDCVFLMHILEKKVTIELSSNEILNDEILNSKIESIKKKISVVFTEHSLIGKTNWILRNSKLKNENSNLIHLRLTGIIDFDLILNNLIELLDTKNLVIHLDIGPVHRNSIDYLDELLFSLVFLQKIEKSNNVVVIPEDTIFFIEFESSKIQGLENSIEFFEFNFCKVSENEILSQEFIVSSPIAVLFVEAYNTGELTNWNGSYLEKSVIFPEKEINKRVAEISIGLNELECSFQLKNDVEINYDQFSDFVESILEQNEPEYKLATRLIFQRILHFLAYNLAQCGVLHDLMDEEEIGELIINSAKYLTENSFNSLQYQQLTQKNIFLNQGKENKNNKEINQFKERVISWENQNGLFITFNENFPIIVYKNIDLVPLSIRNEDEGQIRFYDISDIANSKKDERPKDEIHNLLFAELAHLNNKLIICKYCEFCYKRYPSECNEVCEYCQKKLTSAKLYFEKNKHFFELAKTNDPNEANLDITTRTETKPKIYESEINQGFISFISQSMFKKYVLTPDNYSKILQIHIRAKARLPIIVMGETGCGKTSLIRFLCNFVLDDYFEFFSMHAGVTESILVERVTKFFEYCDEHLSQDCWILFDEFNTSDTIGLIKTLMIDRKLKMRKAPVNAIFIATCNPYKIKRKEIFEEQSVGLKRNFLNRRGENFSLVYNVHPLPESLFHFTFDFGQLSESDERQYAETILKSSIGKTLQKKSDLMNIVNMCLRISRYLKSEFDLSTTSLRDLKRFEIVYIFFREKYIPAMLKHKNQHQDQDQKIIEKDVLVLSVILCYCLRLVKKNQKEAIMQIMSECTGIKFSDFNSVFKERTDELLDLFDLEPDIIKNRALRENIFSMFVCLLNKIPLIIIGKPGSSKTLSLRLIFDKVKGSKSSKQFFQQFEELIPINYQGSEYSTSQNIETIFQKAEERLKDKDINVNKRIPVVVFDEIGLAELSANNPLKVLHSKLELEDITVGFLGVSNWYLDSSKMNRVLTVARADPDLEELNEFSAPYFHSNANCKSEKVDEFFSFLTQVYWEHKQKIQSKGEKNLGVAGLRDFYHLIKHVSLNYKNKIADMQYPSFNTIKVHLYESIVMAIRRNFSYNISYADQMCIKMADLMQINEEVQKKANSIETENLIIENMGDSRSRSLMIITDHEEVHNHIYGLLSDSSKEKKSLSKKYIILIGSKFEKDRDSEAYCVDIISEIINYLDQDIVLIMHQLDVVYTSLYDLFNQSFKKQGSKNYCRIVQGAISKCLYPVHDDFKLVIFLTKEQLENADEPLVNRFEKYSFHKESFLNQSDFSKIKKIKRIFDTIFNTKCDEERISVGKQIFGNFSDSSFLRWKEILIKTEKNRPLDYEENSKDEDLEELMKIFQRSASLGLSRYIYQNYKIKKSESFLKEFVKAKTNSIVKFIQNLKYEQKGTMTIVYTFSSILETIIDKINSLQRKNKDSNQIPNFPSILDFDQLLSVNESQISPNNGSQSQNYYYSNNIKTVEKTLSTIKSEKELKEILKNFFKNESENLLIIKINPLTEYNYLFYLQNMLSNFMRDYDEQIPKHLMLCVFQKQSHLGFTKSFPISSNWKELFFDDLFNGLNEQTEQILLEPNLLSAIQLSQNRFENEFEIMIDRIIFNQTIKQSDDKYLKKLIKYFRDFSSTYGENIRDIIINKIILASKNDKNITSTSIYELLDKQSDIEKSSETFIQRINSMIDRKFEIKLKRVIDLFLNWGIVEFMYFVRQKEFVHHSNAIIHFIEKGISDVEINQNFQEKLPGDEFDLIFPYTRMEYKTITDINKEKFNENSECLIEIIHTQYLSQSFYKKKGIDFDKLSKEQKMYFLIDLIQLHLISSNTECPNIDSLVLILQKLIGSDILKLIKMFVYDPNLIANLFVLLTNFAKLLKKNASKHFELIVKELDQIPRENEEMSLFHNELNFYKNVINRLLKIVLGQEIILDNLIDFKVNYSGVKHSLENFTEAADIDFPELYTFDFLFQIGYFIDKSSIQNSFIHKVLTSHSHLLNQLNIDNFNERITELRELSSGCSYENLVKEKLLIFEVLFYQDYLETIKGSEEKTKTEVVFVKIFKRIEECEEFALLANPIINVLLIECKLTNEISKFLENNDNFSLKTNEDMNDWLEECLKKYSNRLPYLIIATMFSQMKSILTKIEKEKIIETFKNILNGLSELDKEKIIFTKKTLFHLFIIHYFSKELSISLIEQKEEYPDLFRYLNKILNSDSIIAKSLQIYISKQCCKILKINFIELEELLDSIQEDWGPKLKDDFHKEIQISTSNAICYAFEGNDHYEKLINWFKEIEKTKGEVLNHILNYLKNHKGNVSFLAFFSMLINICYSKKFLKSNFVKNILEHLKAFYSDWLELFGEEGCAFIQKIMTNFDSDSPFHISENLNEIQIKQNSSILFAFASILSHKHEKNYFSDFLFRNQLEVVNSFERLNQLYLPGMILPVSPEINEMVSLLEYLNFNWNNEEDYSEYQDDKRVWKCSKDCNYFFVFEDCGQPQVQDEQVKCPICNRFEIGAKDFHEAFDHHVEFRREAAENHMKQYIENYKRKYLKGYFNQELSVKDLEGGGLNVSFTTSNVLNFITNSLLIVLHELKLKNNDIGILKIEGVVTKQLMGKISLNFEEMNSKFESFDSSTIMNLFVSKISSEVKDIQPIKELEEYYTFEKLIEIIAVKDIMNDEEKNYQEYSNSLNKIALEPESLDSLTSYIHEKNEGKVDKYPLAYHLRLDNEQLSMDDLQKKFDSLQFTKNYPITDYLFKNLSQLRHLQVVIAFKNFYDDFRQKYNGKVIRSNSLNYNISKNFVHFFNNDMFDKLKIFIKLWNEFVEDSPKIQYECEKITLTKIDSNKSWSQILPNKQRGDSGTDILLGISLLIKIQNKMLKHLRCRSQGISIYHSWNYVSNKTFYCFDENKFCNKMNKNCLLTRIDYGRSGALKFNFDKFEEILTQEISVLKLFRDDENLIPHFDYMYETGKMNVLLIQCLNSSDQKELCVEDCERIENFLRRHNQLHEQSAYAEIFDFCQNFLLPRAVLTIRVDQETKILEFIKKTMSTKIFEKLTIIQCFETLNLNQIVSFLLFIELLLYKEKIGNISDFESRLVVDKNDREWTEIMENQGPLKLIDIEKRDWDLKVHWNHIKKALMRLVLRTTFNDDPIDDSLENYLKNETLYDISFLERDELDHFSINEKVRLKHCLLFLNSLENGFNQDRIVQPPRERQRPFGNRMVKRNYDSDV